MQGKSKLTVLGGGGKHLVVQIIHQLIDALQLIDLLLQIGFK
jgi:hypothetical protein